MKPLRRRTLWLSTCLVLGSMACFPQVPNAGATTPAFREFTIVHSELSDSPAPVSAGRTVIEAQRAEHQGCCHATHRFSRCRRRGVDLSVAAHCTGHYAGA